MLDIEQTQTNYVQSCLVLSARSEIPRTKYFCIKCFKIQLYEWYQLFFKTVSKNFARYIPVIFSLIVAVILWFLTTRMRVGRNIYALGGNKHSAFYSGIDVKFHMLLVFIISGVCAGLAGVVSTARLGAAEPLAGMGFETYAIASAIIGGTSFFGGKGRIFSVVIGGLIIGTINNGLNILQVQTYYQLVVMGGLIIAAVALDRLISK